MHFRSSLITSPLSLYSCRADQSPPSQLSLYVRERDGFFVKKAELNLTKKFLTKQRQGGRAADLRERKESCVCVESLCLFRKRREKFCTVTLYFFRGADIWWETGGQNFKFPSNLVQDAGCLVAHRANGCGNFFSMCLKFKPALSKNVARAYFSKTPSQSRAQQQPRGRLISGMRKILSFFFPRPTFPSVVAEKSPTRDGPKMAIAIFLPADIFNYVNDAVVCACLLL